MPPALTPPPARLYRCTRGYEPLVLTNWDYIRRKERGRWDDVYDDYRVLYLSDSEVGALVETLQDLRQNSHALAAIGEVDDEERGENEPTGMSVVREALQSRYLATLLPTNPDESIVSIDHGASRTHIESHGLGVHLKIGDFIETDRTLSRATSRLLYDEGYLGLCAPSAEHGPSLTIAAFETHPVSGRVRLNLTLRGTDLALTFGDAVNGAAQYLGLIPIPLVAAEQAAPPAE
jgi:hypothetical protein